MFMGEYEHALDEKNRIIIPNKLRDGLGSRFVMTLGNDGCLFIYPTEAWQDFVGRLSTLPETKEGRAYKRFFMAGAVECEPDKQGRVSIPLKLRDHAGIIKNVISVGVIDKIEIWSKERYEAKDCSDDVDEMAEHMAEYRLKY